MEGSESPRPERPQERETQKQRKAIAEKEKPRYSSAGVRIINAHVADWKCRRPPRPLFQC